MDPIQQENIAPWVYLQMAALQILFYTLNIIQWQQFQGEDEISSSFTELSSLS